MNEDKGEGVVIANRFLAGGRSVISLLAGASRLPVAQTVLWSSISALAWCAALVAAGAWVGTEWERVLDVLGAPGEGKGRWIKRVVATEGQEVSLVDGHLHIDGQPVPTRDETVVDVVGEKRQFSEGAAAKQREGHGAPKLQAFHSGNKRRL